MLEAMNTKKNFASFYLIIFSIILIVNIPIFAEDADSISLLSHGPTFEWKDSQRLTPNNYIVQVREFVGTDYDSYEKQAFNYLIDSVCGDVKRLEDATCKYNGHAYAWYISDLHSDDLVWINDPSIYWKSGCYYEVPENEARVVYYSEKHSALRINSNEYISKLYDGPLVRHKPMDISSSYGEPQRYYKRYLPRIVGYPVVASAITYSIDPLPEGYYVTWSLSDSYYEENCMTQNHSDGTCTITRNANRDMNNATLTATVHYNGYIATTVSKTIHAYSGLKGTYNYTGTDEAISYPYLIYAPLGCMVTIKSPNLVGAKVSYDGDMIPTRWVFDEYRGEIYVTLPQSSQGQALVNTITCADGELYRLIILKKYTYSGISVQNAGSQLVITLNEDASIAPMMERPQVEIEEAENLDWYIEVSDVLTNEKKCSGTYSESRILVDTSGWHPGIYVVRAIVGDQTFTEKIIIK